MKSMPRPTAENYRQRKYHENSKRKIMYHLQGKIIQMTHVGQKEVEHFIIFLNVEKKQLPTQNSISRESMF